MVSLNTCYTALYLFISFQAQKKILEDDGEFLYCLPKDRKNKRARYMPYDLQVVSANEARQQPIYWTISASYVTRVSYLQLKLTA